MGTFIFSIMRCPVFVNNYKYLCFLKTPYKLISVTLPIFYLKKALAFENAMMMYYLIYRRFYQQGINERS